jgi:hypothetical protein
MKTSWDVFKAEGFSGTEIESMHGEGAPPSRGNEIKAPLLQKEPSGQVVHVLAGAAFPGGVGMDEEELCIGFCGERRTARLVLVNRNRGMFLSGASCGLSGELGAMLSTASA